MDKKIIGYLSPKQDACLKNSLAGGIVAGRDILTSESRCHVAVAGKDLSLTKGSGGILIIGNQAKIEHSKIGFLLAKSQTTFNDSKVLVTSQQVVAIGVIAGVIFCFLNILFKHLRKSSLG